MQQAMLLTHLSLTNFRNFIRLETDLPAGQTLLVGANAQGKTSLLEAIHFLTAGSSPHSPSDRNLINLLVLKEQRPFARIVAEVSRQDRAHTIEIRLILETIGPNGEQRLRKEVLINGIKRRLRGLAGVFNSILFLPQDMLILEGSPGKRRRHLNETISQVDPAYAEALAEYGKVLTQRNALLKQLQERRAERRQLTFWNERLAEQAAILIRSRALGLSELEKLADRIHSELSRGKETLRLKYVPAFHRTAEAGQQFDLPFAGETDWTTPAQQVLKNKILETYHNTQGEEIARGITLSGPHRDDFYFIVNDMDLRLYGSRGQNRTAMLSLMLAEVEWLHQRAGEWPVLLLDEVLAELDATRREDLLRRIGSVNQTILTAADMDMFNDSFRRRATVWQIRAGTITPFGNKE